MMKATIIYPKPVVTPPPTVVLEVPLPTAEILYQLLYTAVIGSGKGRTSLDEVWKVLGKVGVGNSKEVRFIQSARIEDSSN